MSYGIQDRQEIQSSIEMVQFERLFFDNINGDFKEEDDVSSTAANVSHLRFFVLVLFSRQKHI